jgi:hypothetical protein
MANYINNKEFLQLLVDYYEKCDEAKLNDKPKPRIPEKIGECFLMIATKLSNKGNFVGYTYKDEMVSDALENCIMAVNSFNPEKSKNPFAYFTQIIWYAFLRRIEKEKKQTYIKYKSLERLVVEASLLDDEGGNGYSNFDLENEKMKPIIDKYEKKTKPKVTEPKGLEKFTRQEGDV